MRAFPESAYGVVVSQLNSSRAGYKVTRVEQTETPASLQERKKSMTRGQKKPEVVCREVCSVVSKGTRTFCYLDDVTLLEKGEASTGPLVVIKEILVDDDAEALSTTGEGMDVDDGDDAGTRAVCEYGVTIVDAVTGVVTLGQFADDVLRSRMQTLLTRFGPMEVSEQIKGKYYDLDSLCVFSLAFLLNIHILPLTLLGDLRGRSKWRIQNPNQRPQVRLSPQHCH